MIFKKCTPKFINIGSDSESIQHAEVIFEKRLEENFRGSTENYEYK